MYAGFDRPGGPKNTTVAEAQAACAADSEMGKWVEQGPLDEHVHGLLAAAVYSSQPFSKWVGLARRFRQFSGNSVGS